MYVLEGKAMRYALDDRGRVASVYNKLTCHEYVYEKGELWKLIYQEGERMEIPVYASDQAFSCRCEPDRLVLEYRGLQGDKRRLDVDVDLILEMDEQGLTVRSMIENRDDLARVMEISVTAVSGVRSLSGEPEKDFIAWPLQMGIRVPNPAYSDLSVYSGFRKYERHDQYHTDLDNPYPGGMSMQWFDWYNQEEGLYVGSHDLTHHTICMHVERDVKRNVLGMGVNRYPMLEKGEAWESAPTVYRPHLGDWHQGSKHYREFMLKSGNFRAPDQPDWARDFSGWLRVILKQHHGECNWTYADIPRLYDEAEAAGMKTLFLLGWEKGGFARRWPDYEVDERMGGEALLRQGIEYVHQKGGKVIMFLSYALVDHQSNFYRREGGGSATIKSMWGEEIPFAETYCGEGSYRKIPNPPMPMYLSCPGSDLWQQKMISSADTCLDLGADGVLYDIGGHLPFFCYDPGHHHGKPSHSHERKAERYKGLRENVKKRGQDFAVLQEHVVDVLSQHMDICHGVNSFKQPQDMVELFRYTFPELIITNRERGQDESDYRNDVNHTALLGLRFDMTIFRCCGALSDIPRYAAYLKEVNALRQKHADTLLRGRFVDEDGFSWDQKAIRAKGYVGDHGQEAVVLWNPTDVPVKTTVAFDNGVCAECLVEPQRLAVARSDAMG